jgi:DNA-directed RNA polymerase specialized sigma24 family protein
MGSGALQPGDMSEPPPQPSAPDKYYTKAEVIATLGALTDTDIARLVDFARYRFLGADHNGLVSDALMQTFTLKRKWKRGVTMRNHLIACMRSIASNRLKREKRNVELSPEHPALPTHMERVLDAKANVKRLREELRDDVIAHAVLNSLGLKPKQAQNLLKMRPDVYEAARKRIRRLADKLLPPRK